MTSAPPMPTNPHAGVMATKPATAPDSAPSIDTLPRATNSIKAHASTAAAVATKVFMKASAATPLASRLDPTLKPNQPTHSSDAPIMVITRLCGGIASLPKPTRLPSTIAATRPAIPALMCTTVPPAKSSAPLAHSQPAFAVTVASVSALVMASGPSQYHTMCATGMYENVNQIAMKASTAANFMRSAKAPMMSAGVIAAKVHWKATNSSSGMTTPLLNVAPTESGVTPVNSSLSSDPKNGLPAVKVSV